jgi:hypothetical protein
MSGTRTAIVNYAANQTRQEHINRWKGGLGVIASFPAGATVTIRGSSKQGAPDAECVPVAILAPAAGNSFVDVQANLVVFWDYLWIAVTGASGAGGYISLSSSDGARGGL